MMRQGTGRRAYSICLYFWPLIILAGRLAVRAVLNLWNMIES